MRPTVLELFAGIGGCATAVAGRAEVIAAVDHDEAAAAAYAELHGHGAIRYNLHYAKPDWFARYPADLWWMSPPCQPYTVRGHRRDLADRRAEALKRVVAAIAVHHPRFVGLENVPGFEGSESEALLCGTLEAAGYEIARGELCPTALGVPAERRRYYLVASREGLVPEVARERVELGTIAPWLDPFDAAYEVPDDLAQRYAGALHIVEADDPLAVAACFTGAYGRSPVYAGSYLRQDGRLRWWTPAEIARSLGFSTEFRLPGGLGRSKAYKLVGNSLSVVAVRHVLARLPVF